MLKYEILGWINNLWINFEYVFLISFSFLLHWDYQKLENKNYSNAFRIIKNIIYYKPTI